MAFRSNKVCYHLNYAVHMLCIHLLTPHIETLIVWTEPSTGIDMALSFQEADGCAQIWFVSSPLTLKN